MHAVEMCTQVLSVLAEKKSEYSGSSKKYCKFFSQFLYVSFLLLCMISGHCQNFY